MRLIPAIVLGLVCGIVLPAGRGFYSRISSGVSAHDQADAEAKQREWRQDFSAVHGKTINAVDLIRYYHLTRKWVNGDLGSLIDELSANGLKSLFETDVLKTSIREAALADPRGTLETLLTRLSPANGRDAALLFAFSVVSKSNPADALAFLPRLPDYLRDRFESQAAAGLGNEKGLQALIAHRSRMALGEWSQLFQSAASNWAQDDPVGAARTVLSLANSDVSDAGNLLEQLVRNMSAKDFALASQSLPQLSRFAQENESAHRGDAEDKLSSLYFNGNNQRSRSENLKSVVQNAEAMPDGPQRIGLIRRLASEAAFIDRNQLIGLAQMLPSYSARKQAYEQALQYGNSPAEPAKNADSAKNAAWAQTIPDPLSKYTVEQDIASTWINSDPVAYAKYALSGNQGPEWASFLLDKFPGLAGSTSATPAALPPWANNLPAGEVQALQALAQKQSAPAQ